jgi:hypothetical protein
MPLPPASSRLLISPFLAEQSNGLSTPENKIRVCRNTAAYVLARGGGKGGIVVTVDGKGYGG